MSGDSGLNETVVFYSKKMTQAKLIVLGILVTHYFRRESIMMHLTCSFTWLTFRL